MREQQNVVYKLDDKKYNIQSNTNLIYIVNTFPLPKRPNQRYTLLRKRFPHSPSLLAMATFLGQLDRIHYVEQEGGVVELGGWATVLINN